MKKLIRNLKRLLLNETAFKSIFYLIIVPLILFLINLALKLRHISWPSLAMDEPFSVYHSKFDILTIIHELSLGNNPPLFETFLHFWTNIFGFSELSVRFPSAVFSSLSVLFIYKICYKFFNTKTAIIASLLFTFSNYQFYFAQEARVYPLFMLLTILSFYEFMNLISSKYSKTNIVFYIIANVLLLYSHFFSLFVIFSQAIILVFTYRNKISNLLRFIKYLGITFLFYTPYLGILINRFSNSYNKSWVLPVTNLRPLHSFYGSLVNENHTGYVLILILSWMILQKYIIRYFNKNLIKQTLIILSTAFLLISLSLRLPLVPSSLLNIENEFSSNIEIVLFLLFYLAIYLHFMFNKNRTSYEKIILSWFFIPCFIMFTSSFYIPMFINRYLIYFTPAFFITLALITTKLDSKISLSISIITVALMAISFTPRNDNNRDVRTLVAKVKEMKKDSNSVVFICPDFWGLTFTYYYNIKYFTNKETKNEMLDSLRSENIFLVRNSKEIDQINKKNNYKKVIYVDAAADFIYRNNNIKEYFNKEFQNQQVLVDTNHVPGIFYIYSYKILN